MTHRTPLLIVAALLVGCEYAPLAVDENRPGLDESVVDPDIVLYGTGRLEYIDRNDNGEGVNCVIEHDIIGWRGAPSVPRSCTTCSEVYTVYRTARDEDTNCPDRGIDLPTQTHAIGWDIVDNIRDASFGSNAEDSQAWLAEQTDAVGVLRTTWNVFGYTDDPIWDPRFVLREVEEDEWPDPPDSDVEFARAYTARDRYRWSLSRDQSVTWRMDLQFTD